MIPAPAPVEPFLDPAKALACVHCGLCLGSCPTYLETGNENDSPRGRIHIMRAVQDGRLALDATTTRHIDLCLGCRACESACPSGVQYGALLEHTRDHIEKHHRRPVIERLWRWSIETIFPRPRLMRWTLAAPRLLRALGLTRLLPRTMREAVEMLPPPQHATAIPPYSPAQGESRQCVGFVTGCVMQVLFQETNHASVRLLNRAGCDVVTPQAQGCCGALFAHSGNLDAARDCARRNIAAFESTALDSIIINAAGCGSMLKEYGALLEDDPVWRDRAAAFSRRVKDLVECLDAAPCSLAPTNIKVTYHDACHLAHAQKIVATPRRLIQRMPGAELVEMAEADLCCGSAGSYNLTEPEMAARLQHRKCANILATGVEVVLTSNPGCILQIQAGLKKAGAGHIRVQHIADFLDAHSTLTEHG